MRRMLSCILALVMVVSLLPAALAAPAAQTVAFAGDGEWINADITVDNTKSYTITYDLDLPAIGTVTKDGQWADRTMFKIASGEDKFYLELQSCTMQGMQYFVFARGSNGNDQASSFSSAYSVPVDAVSVKLTHDANTQVFAWSVCQKGDPDNIYIRGEFGGDKLSAALKADKACTVQFFRKSDVDNTVPNIVPANVKLSYGEILPEGTVPMDPSKNPGNFGWRTENDNYINWQSTTEGDVFEIHHDGNNSKRIWKEMIQDPNNFTLTVNVQVLEHRGYIEVLGTPIELDCHGGNGNQVCEKFSGTYQWLNAIDQSVEVTVARSGGGKMKILFKGKGNTTPMSFEVQPNDENQRNVVLGVYDTPGAARFSKISIQGVEGQNVGDYGWKADSQNYAGWTSLDGVNIDADYAATAAGHRIWKDLISEPEDFAARLTVTVGEEASACVKVLGQTLELDARGGSGDQVYVKLNGEGQRWLAADGRVVQVVLMRRAGGNIVVSLVGAGKIAETYQMTPSEESENLELGIYAGKASFGAISVREPAQCMRPIPFGSAVFAGEITGGAWVQQLCQDIALYQNGAMQEPVLVQADAQKILEAKADLIVIAADPSVLLSGEDIQTYYGKLLEDVKAGMEPNAVILLAGIGHLSDQALGETDVSVLIEANAKLRALAEEKNVLFADIYSAMGSRDWTVEADGKTLSAVGNALVEGEIIERLMRACTCLAVNSTTALRTEVTGAVKKTEAALTAFKNASTVDALRTAVEDRALGLNMTLYRMLPKAKQDQVLSALLAEDRSAGSHLQADMIFNVAVAKLTREDPVKALENEVYTIVTVGDSVTQGTAAVNEKTDAWPIRLLNSLGNILPDRYQVINKGIAGTRMCTITDNKMFPAAKDTVDAYIAANDPDLLIISYGFNDMNAGTSLEEFITTYRAYLQEIRSKCPDTVIMMGNVYPDYGENNRAKATAWNEALAQLAQETGCIFSSNYDDMLGANWLIADGVHPTNAGYRVMAHAHLRTLNMYMDLSDKTVIPENGGQDDPKPTEPKPSEPDPTDPKPTEPTQSGEQQQPQDGMPAAVWAVIGVVAAAALAVAAVLVIRKRKGA